MRPQGSRRKAAPIKAAGDRRRHGVSGPAHRGKAPTQALPGRLSDPLGVLYQAVPSQGPAWVGWLWGTTALGYRLEKSQVGVLCIS